MLTQCPHPKVIGVNGSASGFLPVVPIYSLITCTAAAVMSQVCSKCLYMYCIVSCANQHTEIPCDLQQKSLAYTLLLYGSTDIFTRHCCLQLPTRIQTEANLRVHTHISRLVSDPPPVQYNSLSPIHPWRLIAHSLYEQLRGYDNITIYMYGL